MLGKTADRVLRALTVAGALLCLPGTAAAQYVIGPGPGGTAPIQFIEPGGTRTFDAFPGFLGGVSVTLGDVNGDGVADVIAGAGPGGAPHVKVFNGTDLSELASFFAFDPGFTGGVFVAAGDIDGDGRADIITGAGAGAAPHVRVFSGANLSELASFFAYDPLFMGGVTVAAGDVNGDGRADIVTGAASPGGGPHVRVVSGLDLSELASFFAFDPAFNGGINVAAGDLDGDGLSDVVAAAGPGGGPHVRVFSGQDLSELGSFFAFDPAFGGGVRVATGDIDGDGRVDLILGALDPHIRILSGVDLSEIDSFFTPPEMGAGISVGSFGDPPGVRFTSAATTTFTAGSAGSFTVTTQGGPVPAITVSGALPTGVTFTDNGDRTATLAGMPAAGTGGSYPLTFTADNGIGTPRNQAFTLIVNQAPAITSAAATTFVIGTPGSFTVTTSGFPLPSIALGGVTLPAGITFADNGDGTGTLSGTPDPATGGSYAIAFTATNAAGSSPAQAFVLTVNGPSAFTSASSTTFTVGTPGSFTVTAAGTPAPTITLTAGTLPTGVTFATATGVLSGTPAAGTGGVYGLTFTASNGVGPDSTQAFTLTVNEAPAITSAAAATFVTGTPGSFTVTATGFPAPTFAITGTLPTGVAFDTTTGVLSGTPAAGTGNTYTLTLTATNSVATTAPQAFTLTVNEAPAVTSPNSTTFAVGQAGSFTVTATGFPAPTITHTGGTLPTGVTFDNATHVLSGTPAAGTAGAHALTFTIANAAGTITQNFTLNVNEGPAFTSAAMAIFTLGVPNTFTVTASGFPAPTIALTGGTLPDGVTYDPATGILSGTPAAGTGGNHGLTFTATNSSGSVDQNFTLTVSLPPTITSADTTTFIVGSAGTFTVTADGVPAPTLSVSGALPSGVTFTPATGILGGTPAAGTGGSYPLTFTAANGVPPDATQAFTLIVNEAPAITSANATTFTVGSAGSFNVVMTGFPAPTVSVTAGTLPAGVTLSPAGVLSGTPAAGTGGVHTVTLTATNGVGVNAVQTFTLTVNQAPAFTSAAATTFTVGVAGTFSITTSGFPVITTITRGGVALPAGVTYTDNGTGTATLAGTPAAGTGGTYALTFTISNGVGGDVVQNFTLTINAPPAITSAVSTSFTVGTPGTFTVTTTGFPAPTVSQTGTLPTGVTFTPATNVLAGTATQTGAFPLVFTATNAVPPDATQNFTLNVVCPAITVTPTSLPEGLFQTPYGPVDFNQTGSTGSSFTWSATGPLAGLGIDPATGIVSGTPTTTVAGASVTITVTDNFGCQGILNTTLTIRPVAVADSYTGGVGNTQFVVGTAVTTPAVVKTGTVRDNDNGPGPLTVTFNAPANGTVAEGPTDGTFVYTPNVAFGGPTDTFTYTLTDGNGVTNTATVTIALGGMVWYVNSGPTNGDGRSHSPFNTLANAAAPSGPGSQIYVHTGTGTTTGSLAMDANQTLHGAGAAFALNDLLIPAGTAPTLSGTVTLANNDIVRAVNFSGAAPAMTATNALTAPVTIDQVTVTGGTTALSLTNVSGAVTVNSNSSFTNTSAAEVLISQGTGNVTIAAPISSNAGRVIDIQSRTSGTVTFTGAITDTGGTGILLQNNGTSTFSFSGGLTLNGTGTTFTATNSSLGGTLTITGTNTIGATTPPTSGTALNVSNINIGASGLTFRSISGDGVTNGISLNNTGATAGLTITGNGGTCTSAATCTGGGIQNTTSHGVSLTSTLSPSFTHMFIGNNAGNGVNGTDVTNFTFQNSVINNSGTGLAPEASNIAFNLAAAATENNLDGVVTITNNTLTNAYYHGVDIFNFNGTITTATITGNTITSTTSTATSKGTGIRLVAFGSAATVANVTQATIANNVISNFPSANGILASGGNGNLSGPAGVFGTAGHATNKISITGNQLTGGPKFGAFAIGATVNGRGQGNFDISNNGTVANPITNSIGTAISVGSFGFANVTATINNNRIVANNIAGAQGIGAGTSQTVSPTETPTLEVTITNNNISQTDGNGILVTARDATGVVRAKIQNNTVAAPLAGNRNGIRVDAGNGISVNDSVCLNISGNTSAGVGLSPEGIGVRKQGTVAGTNNLALHGFATSPATQAQTVTFVSGQNPGSANGTLIISGDNFNSPTCSFP